MFTTRGPVIECDDCGKTEHVGTNPNAIARWKAAHQRVCRAVKR